MPASKVQFHERAVGDVTILVLSGEILLDEGDLAFRQRIHDLINRGRIKILVDLAGVTYIDSAGVGMMAAKLKTVRERGGDMRLLRLTTRSQRLLSVLKLRTAFEVFDDEEMALGSFERRPN